jgi:hypothetical protein
MVTTILVLAVLLTLSGAGHIIQFIRIRDWRTDATCLRRRIDRAAARIDLATARIEHARRTPR